MRLKIENQKFFFNLVNKGHKVDIFNKEISSIDFFCSRTERVKLFISSSLCAYPLTQKWSIICFLTVISLYHNFYSVIYSNIFFFFIC